ncbi:hypothetical protein DKX38_013577 [Salix brachista]|uniref:Reverse transcriptase domain-containing protein n=1 Tax=Salix brachista TaxID=2182728 RepID=A0A5N5LD40_9ROSI|nr:hypothetical protein DKX38_013577 [Salix brachista]
MISWIEVSDENLNRHFVTHKKPYHASGPHIFIGHLHIFWDLERAAYRDGLIDVTSLKFPRTSGMATKEMVLRDRDRGQRFFGAAAEKWFLGLPSASVASTGQSVAGCGRPAWGLARHTLPFLMEPQPPNSVLSAPPVVAPSYVAMADRGLGQQQANFQPNFSPRAYNKSFQFVLMGEKRSIVTDTRSSEKFQNAPAAIFYDDEVDALAAPLQHTLVGFALLNLAKSLGPPIQMDEATAKGTRPSKARVCIEFDCLLAPNNNLKLATEGVTKNKAEWVKVQHKKTAPKHVDNNGKESQKLEMDKGDPIPPLDKGKSIQIDNTPILVDERTCAKNQDREIVRDTPLGSLIEIEIPVILADSNNLQEAKFCSQIGSDSVVGDSQPIGLNSLNMNAPIPSNCNTIESTKSLNFDGRFLKFESHPRILTRQNSEGDVTSHYIKKDLDHNQCLTVSVNTPWLSQSFFISFVYAKNLRSERKFLWDELCEIASILDGPWAVGGDFNVVFNVKESKGGDNPNQGSMEEFGSCLLDYWLLDAGYEGNDFTWTNGKVLRRLDRIAFNLEWSDLFSLTRVKHLNRVGSDHCPLLFQCSQAVQTFPSSFSDPSSINREVLHKEMAILNKTLFLEEKFWQQKSGYNAINVDANDIDWSFIPNIITNEDNNFLTSIHDRLEIRTVVFECDANSAAGPNGFSGASSTTIVLIPKVSHPKTWGEFRPTMRIEDNILLAQELVQSIDEKTRGSNVILKLDMMKAYDRIDWAFIIKIMCKFGFCSKMTDMIGNCISNCWFSVLFNGEITGYFHGSRGLRQGDPISPTLFIIVVEYLSRGLYNMFQRYPSLHYLARCPVLVPHLAFADDIIIFSNGVKSSLMRITNFLAEYEQCSGQKVNSSKSGFILSSRASLSRVSIVDGALGFPRIRLPTKYLGMPLYKGTKKRLKGSSINSCGAPRGRGESIGSVRRTYAIPWRKGVLACRGFRTSASFSGGASVHDSPIWKRLSMAGRACEDLIRIALRLASPISLFLIVGGAVRVLELTILFGRSLHIVVLLCIVLGIGLQGKGICTVSKCYGCNGIESLEHLFLFCPSVSPVWNFFAAMFSVSLPVDGSIRHWFSA